MESGKTAGPMAFVAFVKGRPLVADAALGLLLAVISLLALVFQARSEHLPEPTPAAVALVLLINLPLALRRRYPFGVNLAVGALSALYGALPYPDLVTPVPLGGVVALYSLAAWCDRRKAVAVGVVAALSVVLVAWVPQTDSDVLDFAFTTVLLAAGWVLGDSARIRRAHTAELEERAAWLARERDFEARRAVTAERARIARELHDVIAHHVSMMVVQAEAGPVVAERDPARAAHAFDAIAGVGRQALVEMRRLLGVLREETADTGDTGDDLVPQPGMAQVAGLVEQVREAGLAARLEVEGRAVALPAGVDLSAYRIVQEALTNAVKHAGPSVDRARVPVRVRIAYGDAHLSIEVRDHGRGSPPGGDGPREAAPGSGHGLAGMRERVHLFGGELTAGPAPDGGFAVLARLPIGGAA
ncbi:sensor histidine kinase [Spongiactinospora sp. TRM90649]|uniref:sensor histidine kinase n=1 Tax=Spongiactinospora sp. TRM90649 TaxID=3031114 RepID=UPI0023F6BDA6|nr:sensor histidine kinase [Spongiactinospora sp. TRM90649]MDF5751612.1 sensor histidine kinase [Spongiactinospora sp. TRM90649]